MRALLLTLAAVLAPLVASAQGTGTLAGTVVDEFGEPLPGATIRIEGTSLGAAADVDGNYRIVGVPVGTYDVVASYIGYEGATVEGIEVVAGMAREHNFVLSEADWDMTVCYFNLGRPIVESDPFASRVVAGADIANLPVER